MKRYVFREGRYLWTHHLEVKETDMDLTNATDKEIYELDRNARLQKIAREECSFPTLVTRGVDRYDFHEVSAGNPPRS